MFSDHLKECSAMTTEDDTALVRLPESAVLVYVELYVRLFDDSVIVRGL